MKITYITTRLTEDEKETTYCVISAGVRARQRTVRAETTYLPDYRKFVRQGWTCLEEIRFKGDDSVVGGVFEAPVTALSIRRV